MNLRRRGGAVADIAILVIDLNKGFQVQTYESLNILKNRKTPFLVAANMLDRVPGWKPKDTLSFMKSLNQQPKFVQDQVNELLYMIMGELSKEGFESERYDRVKDFTSTIALIPTSAKSGEGIAELLMVLSGLTQQFLKKRLRTTKGPGKGVVLEVKEEPGLGVTIDAIIYEGIIRNDQTIVVGGLDGALESTIRALLLPKPLDEIRDPKEKFNSVKEVVAAAGIKISGANLDGAVAGSPLMVVDDQKNLVKIKESIQAELEAIRFSIDKKGVILKADALGSLEAITNYLKNENILIHKADVGDVSKHDVVEAITMRVDDPFSAAVLAFNVKILSDAKELARSADLPIFSEKIIYKLHEEFSDWVNQEREAAKQRDLDAIIRPGVVKFLLNHTFRRNKPAVIGVVIQAGMITPNARLINSEGVKIGKIRRIQEQNEDIKKATEGKSVAISIDGPTVGRQIKEGDILYVDIPEPQARIINYQLKNQLTPSENKALEELVKIKRKTHSYWGM
jgi:translation initiation factor 5B